MLMVVFVIALAASFTSVRAADVGFSEVLETGQTLKGPGLFAGNLVRVDGTVEGTTFAFGQEVQINGVIDGDLFVAAQTVTINGKVNGNIYSAGQKVSFGTQTTGDVFAAGQTIDIGKEAVIGRDLFAVGSSVFQQGTVGRLFSGAASDISISGSVRGDVNLEGAGIKLQEGANISGNLSYTAPQKAAIASGSKINGKTSWQYKAPAANKENTTPASFIWRVLWSIFSALLIWFLISIWKPDFWAKDAQMIAEQPLKTIGVGVLAFITTPFLAILIMVTIIGIPLAIIMLLVYGICFYLSKIAVAVFVGSWLTKRFGWTEIHKGIWSVLLGLTILALLTKVPVLGWLIWIIIVFAGMGAFIMVSGSKQRS